MPTVLGAARNAAIDECLRAQREADDVYKVRLADMDKENARELKRLKPGSPAYLAREERQKQAREMVERHYADQLKDAMAKRDKIIHEIDGVTVGRPA